MGTLDNLVHACLWPRQAPDSRIVQAALIVARYLYALLRELSAGEISLRAMGLVYTTMLAVVPLLAFSFSVAKGLNVHRELEPLLLRFLEPIGPRAGEISASVVGFVDNVSGSVLAALSIALLLLTALSMAQKIESSFNYVWRVDRPRRLARRIGDYMSVILLGPVVMVFATGAVAALASATIVERLAEVMPFGWLFARLESTAPYLLVIVAFSILYMLIPNTRVSVRAAVIGAVCGGIAWVSAGRIFTATIVSSTRFEAIYSGFAIVIIVMLWLHISWLILLLGSQLAYYVQHPYQLSQPRRSGSIDSPLRERLALSIMFLIGRDFEQPGHGWRAESLAAELRTSRASIDSVMSDLTAAGLLTQSAEQRLMPARDPHRVRLKDILDAARGVRGAEAATSDRQWHPAIERIADDLEAAIDSALGAQTLADLVEADIGAEAGDPRAAGGEQRVPGD